MRANSSIASASDTISMLRHALSSPARHCLIVAAFYSLVFLVFFLPALYQGHLLALSGDGLSFYLPNFYARKVLWDRLLFSGFPMMADPQVMTWYPPAAVLSLLPGTWNLFMLMAYVAASSFMYAYVYTLTTSRLAALVSGLVFGLSGFMLAHLVHVVIIHSVAWVPLILWSLEMLRRRLSAKWLLIGSISVTMSFLGGHAQIFIYALLLSAAYGLMVGWSASQRWQYYLASLGMVILGIGLAAVQIIPTIELLGQSIRLTYRFQDFVAHALPPRQAITMIFPMVFGGPPGSGTGVYFGPDNQTELTGYVGLLPLMLSAVGLIVSRMKSLALFWLSVALLAFVLVMGDANPLARLLYHVPVLNSFRAPARHFFELTLALSVLSGLGVAAIVRQQVSSSTVRKVILLSSLTMAVCVVLLFMNAGYMRALATAKGSGPLNLLPWANRAVGIPVTIFLVSTAILAYWHGQPQSILRSALLLLVLVVDLGSFGWFFDWRYTAVNKTDLTPTVLATRYTSNLNSSNQRLMPYRSFHGTTEMAPNLTRLWGVPNASGYNALIFSRMRNQLPMIDYCCTALPWSETENKSLDLAAVRYVFLPPNKATTDRQGISWFEDDMKQWLGSGCSQAPRSSLKFVLPAPIRSTSIAVVSRLACSTQVPDQTEVARMQVMGTAGKIQTRSLLAGRDSTEWAYDCASVRPQMRHQRAGVFSSFPSMMYDEACTGHFYVTQFSLGAIEEIKSIEFDWLAAPPASMSIEKITLINDESKTSSPIDSAFVIDRGWRLIEETTRERIAENLRAMPRAWLTRETQQVTEQEALDAIKTGSLGNGRPFDPNRTTLVEEPLALTTHDLDTERSASVTELSDTRMEVRTTSAAPGFLVTSDAYYPGWRATVDGIEAHLYRADYTIRGVVVPSGNHVVRFEYRPRSFYYGAAITIVSLLAALLIALWRPLRDSYFKRKAF